MWEVHQTTRRDAALLAGATLAGMLVIVWGACFLIAPVWQPGYGAAVSQTASASRPLINPNTADVQTLMELPGVGQQKAQAIVAYREENGPFLSAEELSLVPGISQQMVDSWAEYMTLDPEF